MGQAKDIASKYSYPKAKAFITDLFECPLPKGQGVYLIGNFYIGRSANMAKRIRKHVTDCPAGTHHNEKLQAEISALIKENIRISVTVLSLDVSDEGRLILLHRPRPASCK